MTGSVVMALHALSQAVPDRLDEWQTLSKTHQSLSDTVRQLHDQLSVHHQAAEATLQAADTLALRRARLLDAIQGVPLRLLALHDHTETTRIRVQVGSLSVLQASPGWSKMRPESIHATDAGVVIALRIDE